MQEEEDANLYEVMLDSFYDPAPDDDWAATNRELARQFWQALRTAEVSSAEWGAT